MKRSSPSQKIFLLKNHVFYCQVKERANQRKIAWKNANLKRVNEKTVEEEARKQLQREEKQRLDNIKREEEEIRKEMVKIRRVMTEENALRAKQYTR